MSQLPEQLLELELGAVAHGGYVVARNDNKVVFVTGGLPGELVRARITSRSKRFDRANVVEVLRAAPGRVQPPCPIAQDCGGCDWQHADQETQLELKRSVVAEQLHRLAGISWNGQVLSMGAAEASRSRLRYALDVQGRAGMRARRSHQVVPLPLQGCLVSQPEAPEQRYPGVSELTVVQGETGTSVLADGRLASGPKVASHEVLGVRFEVSPGGFWQSHPKAAEVLADAVLDGLQPWQGATALDLYCGVGLFAGVLADRGCEVVGVEENPQAVRFAKRNVPNARFLARSALAGLRTFASSDLVVLDPPRRGAGSEVVQAICALEPKAVAYVSCDPATLARDLAEFDRQGLKPAAITAYDLFPMTHHVEVVAILQRK